MYYRKFSLLALFILPLVGCGSQAQTGTSSLQQARAGHVTKITRPQQAREPVATPPAGVFDKITYQAAPGALAAYVTPDPRDGKRHPAIVWITGGDCNSIGDVWTPAPARNDQTAAAYRQAGIVMMFPSLRGGNTNPGQHESFYGEVDDVIAAADYLARQSYVDPNRIYLGGHSTGGTLALLVAESTGRFRAVFAYGPVANAADYGETYTTFDLNDKTEEKLRAPVMWLSGITSPTFVLEGSSGGNLESLQLLEKYNKNRNAHFIALPGANHFSILAPTNRFIASQILQDTGATCRISFTASDVAQNFANAAGGR